MRLPNRSIRSTRRAWRLVRQSHAALLRSAVNGAARTGLFYAVAAFFGLVTLLAGEAAFFLHLAERLPAADAALAVTGANAVAMLTLLVAARISRRRAARSLDDKVEVQAMALELLGARLRSMPQEALASLLDGLLRRPRKPASETAEETARSTP